MRKIIYPDADEDDDLVAGKRLDLLRKLGNFEIHHGPPKDHTEFAKRVQSANALLLGWSLPVEVMRTMNDLEVISFSGVGAANFIDLPEARARGITVCNCPGYSSNTVAEHTLALLLAAVRHIPKLHAELKQGRWNQALMGIELRGKILGLIGFGGIAQRVAELAESFGMHIRVCTRNPSPERAAKHSVEFVQLDELLRTCDILSLHATLTEETKDLLGGKEFARMKDGVILVNTARGELIDEDALTDALRSGKVKTAALDVFRIEPLRRNHPFLQLDNVIMSPHVAYNTPEAREMLYDIAVDNLVKFYDGNPINVVVGPALRS